jgi:hypothetical protein
LAQPPLLLLLSEEKEEEEEEEEAEEEVGGGEAGSAAVSSGIEYPGGGSGLFTALEPPRTVLRPPHHMRTSFGPRVPD